MILSMFVGGDVGSTAGGIKIVRLLILARLVQVLLQRTSVTPHAVLTPRLGGRRIEADEARDAVCLAALFAGVNAASWVAFLAAGYDPLNALFDVASATGTVGLSSGVTSADLPAALKAVLCFDMLAGRLEVVALLVLFYPRTWIGRRARAT
jgi:trk system potassium uptake protein TrkH